MFKFVEFNGRVGTVIFGISFLGLFLVYYFGDVRGVEDRR